MATANPPPGALAVDHTNGSDPFVTSSYDTQRQRYSAFDNSQFSLYLNGSPAQAKRALEAHLAETTRRLQETSQLGNALVLQRKELEEKLHEVDQQQQDNDIGPELRQRLAELEKEFNEVGRETARTFLPKSRVPSGETDITGGIYATQGQHSPTKVSVPSRKQRNQQPSRINDVALATEISTSLLSQLKELQSVLRERDEALRAADLDRSQLEIERDGLSQRLRVLDESESRLKDVNWNLETQVREAEAQSKATADKEQRLNHALSLIRAEKADLESKLEDWKTSYAKLNDDHINKTKQNETELLALRRNVTMTETEKNALQRKVEDLANQNQELARAVAYRMKVDEQAAAEDTSTDDNAEERETQTPEHSPPPSPSKATPRHGILESETLKHSLQHAHRMIQQLKNNIHREKTEKIELKRMLQDARDELETNRGSLNAPGSASKRRKNDKDIFKKPARPDRLGALRAGTQEIVMDDDEWEEQEGMPSTPSQRPRQADRVPGAFASDFSSAAENSATEGFETANETSDAAFETANERDGMTTETDAFMTGAETLDGGSSDELTETEAGPTRVTVRPSRSSLTKENAKDSYESTASTSGDENEDFEFKTPIQRQTSRFRLRAKQDSSRKSTPRGNLDFYASSPVVAQDSPASFAGSSRDHTPAQGKSLFAELNDLSGDEDDGSILDDGTPSRSSSVLFSPESSPESSRKPTLGKSPLQLAATRPTMVDSGTMTEPEPIQSVTLSSIKTQDTQPQIPRVPQLQVSSLSAQDTMPQAPKAQDLGVSSLASQSTTPELVPIPVFNMSSVSEQTTLPQEPAPAQLVMSSLSTHETSPQAVPVQPFAFSTLSSQDTTPQAVPKQAIGFSSMLAQDTTPIALPRSPLDLSAVSAHTTEPQELALPRLGFSSHTSHGTEPIAPKAEEVVVPSLNVSSIASQSSEPHDGHEPRGIVPIPLPIPLSTSTVASHATEPQEPTSNRELPVSHTAEPREISKAAPMQFSNVSAHATEPLSIRPQLSSLSQLSSQTTEPLAAEQSPHQFSTLSSHATEPVAPPQQPLQVSSVSSWSTEPQAPPQPLLKMSVLSSNQTEPVQPKTTSSQLSTVVHQSSEPLEPREQGLSISASMSSQSSEPIEPQRQVLANSSLLSALETQPLEPQQQARQVSSITSQHTVPVNIPIPVASFSDVTTLHATQPESPTVPVFMPTPSRPSTANRNTLPAMTFSNVSSQGTEPSSRPVTAHRDMPMAVPETLTSSKGTEAGTDTDTSALGYFDAVPQNSGTIERSAPISPPRTPRTPMTDEGTQTMVSAEQIDKLLLARSPRYSGNIATAGVEKALSPPPSPSRRHSNEAGRVPRRPGSSGSMRSRTGTPPPLPPDHKEVIAAAAKSLPPVPVGAMGPPTMPASAYKKRPQTPSIKTGNVVVSPKAGGTAARARRYSQRGDARSGASSPISRRSSLSSFTSEVDQRFNIAGGPSFAASALPPGATDPRMIQAITQTMIGEYLWKYTRKAGREGLSENRHRRFFWIHPYTRTLYWSDKDPQTAGKTELKGKSVLIESVQEVEDTNPLPPGLHQKSLIVTTPGRSIKFTATTGQRHETWFNALSYLCQRVEEGEVQSPKPAVNDEIQDEFNGRYRSSSRATGRSRASMASHATRRTSSPHQIPTLRQSSASQVRASSTEPGQGSVSSRISSILRPTSAMRGSFSSRYSRASAQESTTYEQPNSANTELGRGIQEQVERDLDNMVNVRACCDGKHDVGHLHMPSLKGRHSSNTVNSRPSLIGSLSSRSQSRAESYAEARNDRIRHQNEMEASNFGAC